MHLVTGSDSTSVEHQSPVREERVRISSPPPVPQPRNYALKCKFFFLLIEKTLGCVPMPWNCIKLVTTELGIRKKQLRKVEISVGKVEISVGKVKSSGGKVVAQSIAQVKKQLEDFPELAKRDVKELDSVKKNVFLILILC